MIADFARATALARDAGCDAVELHFGHGYLVSQFLSPFTNRRGDGWGGSLANRMRLGVEILRAVRATLGPEFPVLAKVNLRDGFPGGAEVDDAIEVARTLEREGVSGLVLSGGFVGRTPLYMLRGDVPFRDMAAAEKKWVRKVGLYLFGRLFVQQYPWEETFFLDDARRVRAAVRLPLALLGGIVSRATVARAMDEGFELAGMARALLHDATLPRRLERGEVERSGCIPCNRCIAEMDRGGVRCVRSAAPHLTR